MITTILEGGIVMSKALNDPKCLARRFLLLRTSVKLLSSGAPARLP